MPSWLRLGPPSVSATEVAAKLEDTPPPLVLDVRNPNEYASGHIRGARSLPLHDLPDKTGALPRVRELICVCASGSRSRRATSILSKQGFYVLNLKGGMGAWTRAGLPVQRGGSGTGPRKKPRKKR